MGCFGPSTSGMESAAGNQQGIADMLKSQGQQIFGNSSNVFNDLYNAYAPIVAAGPGQEGYGPAQMAGAKSTAITEVGNSYRNASQAVRERMAAAGGGNIALPSGAEVGANLGLAEKGAAATSSELLNIESQSRELGYRKWLAASQGLAGAPQVFEPALGFEKTGAEAQGSAFGMQNTIYNAKMANNPWKTVGGALGGIAGSAFLGPIGGAIGSKLGGLIGSIGSGHTPSMSGDDYLSSLGGYSGADSSGSDSGSDVGSGT